MYLQNLRIYETPERNQRQIFYKENIVRETHEMNEKKEKNNIFIMLSKLW